MTASNPPFATALMAGGIAGTTVDLTLFPLDTLKTRLQSSAGFFPSGGFSGIYRGIGSAVVGSAPGAAFFFCTYEATKSALAARRHAAHGAQGDRGWTAAADHMLAASLGEIAACAVRVPTEVVKQRAQAGQHGGSSAAALRAILSRRAEVGLAGVWRELYRGWSITVLREVPFTVIQFPLWEALKRLAAERRHARAWSPADPPSRPGLSARPAEPPVATGLESAVCGSLAGAVAAGVTTPLDVLKTRVMLAQERQRVLHVLSSLLREHGVRPFFAGIGPRVAWISIGGAIFLGSYQWAVNILNGVAV